MPDHLTAPSETTVVLQDIHEHQSSHEIKRRTVRGGLFSVAGQGSSFILRTGSMVVIARLLTPEQFGIVGMVTAFTGFLALFRDAGLSMATVQRPQISHGQTSTLFWINVAVGALLTLFCLGMAPVLSSFYHEPRLFWITVAFATGFFFYGVAAQHRALLQRNMRFGRLVLVDSISLLFSVSLTIAMALTGFGYWALVAMSVSLPVFTAIGMWLAQRWVPGLPRRGSGVRSMLHYGGIITLNSFIVYLVYNTEKVLLGRYWGAEELGIYGRGYQLINLPTDNLNTVMGSVMFPALSRVQRDPLLLRTYFLKGYNLFLTLVMPVTMCCGLFAEDIVRVLLGPQWNSVVPVFRFLTPTILAFALINPLAWLMQASGLATRSLRISFLIGPVVICGYLLGLPHRSQGVALGFSVAMSLLVLPVVFWAKSGTLITARDIFVTALKPALASVAGGVLALSAGLLMDGLGPVLRLTIMTLSLFAVYFLVLTFGLGQKGLYLELLRASGFWGKRSV